MTNSIRKVISRFFILLLSGLGFVFFGHLIALNYNELPLFDDKIVLAYLINLLLAITIFLTLFFLRNKYRDSLGFLFMFGSLLKFGAFFILFYSSYNADGEISRLEFFAFFIPYAICLIIETTYLSKLLNLK